MLGAALGRLPQPSLLLMLQRDRLEGEHIPPTLGSHAESCGRALAQPFLILLWFPDCFLTLGLMRSCNSLIISQGTEGTATGTAGIQEMGSGTVCGKGQPLCPPALVSPA